MRTGPHGVRESYNSAPLARKFAGPPKGAYIGFTPTALGSVLTLATEPAMGYSLLKVHSFEDPAGIDIIVEGDITLDFATASASDLLPDGADVVARASYYEDAEATAEIVTRPRTATTAETVIGPSPVAYDLALVSDLPTVPGSISMSVDVDGSGADTITDDGAGALVSAGPALPGGGTIDYATGAMTGVTAPLTALSTVYLTRRQAVLQNEVLLCRITGTPGTIVVNALLATDRDRPLAAGAADLEFGFMPPTSMEALAAAVEIVNEVTAARVDLQNTTHASLGDRLDYDLGAEAMGIRLGNVAKLIRSNAYAAAAGVSQVNISGSMSAINRDYEPKLTFAGSGSETSAGVITAPDDTVRNVAIVLDAGTGERLIDNATDRNIVVGRVEQADDEVIDGALTFTNALTIVLGDGSSAFTVQLETGDTVQGPDGTFYEVATIVDDARLILRDAYQSVTASSAGLLRRRFLLKLTESAGGIELDYALEAAITIELFFPVFLSHAQANFHNALVLHRSGARPPVPDAGLTVPGKVELAGSISPFAGAVELQERGTPVPGGPYHTLNFTATEAQLTELSEGSVEVLEIGPKGSKGLGGGPGPQGPDGETGQSYNNLAALVLSEEHSFASTADMTFSHNFGFNIGMLSGGIARFRNVGGWVGGFTEADWIQLTDIRIVDDGNGDPRVGVIEAEGAGNTFAVLYLNAAGYTE